MKEFKFIKGLALLLTTESQVTIWIVLFVIINFTRATINQTLLFFFSVSNFPLNN